MNRHPALSLDLDDGIDRKVLGQLRQRFLAVNAGRLQRARQALSSRQERVLRLLPLLFHINHPLLPGYLSASTPAGLSGFEADDEVLAEAQRLARSFVYKPRRQEPAQQPIHGLFLMGSLGSLAQEEQSDLDLWVCHAPELEPGARQELRRKCALIEDWARSQGSEVHCFLIDVARFGQDEREDRKEPGGDGNTQHFLLLDEFYRSAIWLGGRTPLWWLVPPAHERRYDEYCRTLLGKRFIRAEEVLDLGHLAHIPPGSSSAPASGSCPRPSIRPTSRCSSCCSPRPTPASTRGSAASPCASRSRYSPASSISTNWTPTSWSIAISNATCGNSRRRNAWNSCGAACTSRSGASSAVASARRRRAGSTCRWSGSSRNGNGSLAAWPCSTAAASGRCAR